MDPFAQLWGPPRSTNAGPLTLNLIKGFEGFAPVAKWDVRQHSGGYGTKAQPGERFTPETAQARLEQEVAPINTWLDKNVTVPLKPEQRAAFSSFGYNLGVDDLEKLLPDINRGDWQTVGNRMLSFNKALNEKTGQLEPLDGLTSRRRKEASLVMGGELPETPMPTPQQPGPLASSFRDNIPQIFGGSENQGYFGRVLNDPMFIMGLSTLGAGLSGQDAGTALSRGAQAASATSDLADRRRRTAYYQQLMSGQGGKALEGVPPDILEIMKMAGPEEGMRMLGQLAMERQKRSAPREMAPGATLYDPTKGEAIFTAPTSKQSPFEETVQRERAKAEVDAEGRTKVGQQMISLFDEITKLAGEEGSADAQTFEETVGPMQGSGTYQAVKGFFNSKSKTPQVFNEIQQYAGTIRMLAQRAYLSGQGQVTEAERKAVNDAIGAVEKAPSREAALRAVETAKGIIQGVFMKGAQGMAPAGPGGPGAAMPPGQVAPGLAVEGAPELAPQPAPTPGAPPPAPGAPPPAPGAPPPAPQAPAGPPPQRAVDFLLQNPSPQIIQQFDAKYGPGAAQRLIMQHRQPQPDPATASFGMSP